MGIANQVIKAAEDIQHGVEERLTVLWDEIKEWQQDNHFITSGYRPESNSYRKSVASLRYIHNETVNIYSHLIGTIYSVIASVVLYFTLKPRYETATLEDVAVFSCFFFGSTACLGMSATYHLISNHSSSVSKFGNHLDYVGIVFMIWGSFIPSIYYGFSTEPALIRRYWTMITTIGAGTALVAISPQFRTPKWRPFRAAMFVAMGLSAIVPVLHGLELFGQAEMEKSMALRWMLAQGMFYILGAVIYAARVPERLAPGRFDIWGSSHQIFHVLVLTAAATHLTGLLRAFDYRHGKGNVMPVGVFDGAPAWLRR
ncbi:HlyIII-domain-containing protein [Trichodelitschia bisporula]|uniref:HlyIII-domain-containing protein n=1 Tax=Trichodelitschia bisporula TaxID=703511 RepID=A0A6G1HJL6_9PEZI|nr:HlyIII-domain-containing protein [Trichodelitschia bisporula]